MLYIFKYHLASNACSGQLLGRSWCPLTLEKQVVDLEVAQPRAESGSGCPCSHMSARRSPARLHYLTFYWDLREPMMRVLPHNDRSTVRGSEKAALAHSDKRWGLGL